MKGKNSKSSVKHLNVGNSTLTSEKDIANKLVETFAKHSSSSNYKPDFQKFKQKAEKTKLNFKSDKSESYNSPFSLDELKTSLGKAHDTACGPDNIHYQLLKHLPDISMTTLLNLMNDVYGLIENCPKFGSLPLLVISPNQGRIMQMLPIIVR